MFLNDGFLVRRELAFRNLTIDVSCPLCDTEEECLDHLFIAYDLAHAMWFTSPLNIRTLVLVPKLSFP